MAAQVNSTTGSGFEAQVRYLPCPVCSKLMNRVDFAHCSHVIVDVCKGHGTWFDKDELQKIVEFIKAGGMETSRAQQMDDLESRRRQLAISQSPVSMGDVNFAAGSKNYDAWDIGISTAAAFLKAFFR
jgi:Zn-finger nucleic acid-binding protein